jgi:uncharacterized membrane protein
MTKSRLEAFSDGVLAIIITIMVLELKVPYGTAWVDIKPLCPVLMSYVLSFAYIAIYWGNHHHLLHTVTNVSSKIIWSNMHLLFWLTLVPFATEFMGENNFAKITVAVYASLLLICGLAYYILQQVISKNSYTTPALELAMKGQTKKGIISMIAYTISIPLAFFHEGISAFLIFVVAVMWIVPDKNIEKALKE